MKGFDKTSPGSSWQMSDNGIRWGVSGRQCSYTVGFFMEQ
ncbi:hypothetical protein LX87_03953 [Larkinella arboricola]|uniref:Uncharacterized protein n=1 Tax=Larkinella arboricola TaxID=643671 RepID=A0A327WQ44_LARAB|nr:hypothetical protein LX87_03953 [Larkinella arboricola]